jgi:16S rRNA C1402 (ribose-2'-O) methylase RsmI
MVRSMSDRRCALNGPVGAAPAAATAALASAAAANKLMVFTGNLPRRLKREKAAQRKTKGRILFNHLVDSR